MILDSLANLGFTELRSLIETVKGIAPDIWAIYVKQQVVSAYTTVAFLGFFTAMVSSIAIFWYVKLKTMEVNYPEDRETMRTAVMVGAGIIITIVLSVSIPTVLPKILNPEYYAIQALLGRGR